MEKLTIFKRLSQANNIYYQAILNSKYYNDEIDFMYVGFNKGQEPQNSCRIEVLKSFHTFIKLGSDKYPYLKIIEYTYIKDLKTKIKD